MPVTTPMLPQSPPPASTARPDPTADDPARTSLASGEPPSDVVDLPPGVARYLAKSRHAISMGGAGAPEPGSLPLGRSLERILAEPQAAVGAQQVEPDRARALLA